MIKIHEDAQLVRCKSVMVIYTCTTYERDKFALTRYKRYTMSAINWRPSVLCGASNRVALWPVHPVHWIKTHVYLSCVYMSGTTRSTGINESMRIYLNLGVASLQEHRQFVRAGINTCQLVPKGCKIDWCHTSTINCWRIADPKVKRFHNLFLEINLDVEEQRNYLTFCHIYKWSWPTEYPEVFVVPWWVCK